MNNKFDIGLIRDWARRHAIEGNDTDLRCAFEDAISLLPNEESLSWYGRWQISEKECARLREENQWMKHQPMAEEFREKVKDLQAQLDKAAEVAEAVRLYRDMSFGDDESQHLERMSDALDRYDDILP